MYTVLCFALVVKWISQLSSEQLFWVRILAGAPLNTQLEEDESFDCRERKF